jgi:hypothetical protein
MQYASKIAFHILFLFCSLAGWAQIAEVRTYGGDDYDEARKTIQTEDGYVLVGTTSSALNGNSDVLVQFVLNNLDPYFEVVLGGAAAEQGRAIVQNEDGTLLVLGQTANGPFGGYDAVIYKLTADGNLLWEKYFGTSDWDLPIDLVAGDGKIYLGMTSYGTGTTTSNQRIIVINEDGDLDGIVDFDQAYDGELSDIDWYNGSLYTIGTVTLSDGNQFGIGRKLSGSLDVEWSRYEAGLNIFGRTVSGSPYGATFGFDYADPTDNNKFDNRLVQYDFEGDLEWRKNFDQPGNQRIRSTAWSGAVVIYASETDVFGAGGLGAIVVKVYYTGGYLSSAVFGGDIDDSPYHILVDSDSNYLICGRSNSYSAGDQDFYLVRTFDNTIVSDFELDFVDFASDFYIGIPELNPNYVFAYPVPASEQLTLTVYCNWELFDSMGRSVQTGQSTYIDVSAVATGHYVLKNNDAPSWQQQVIIQH